MDARLKIIQYGNPLEELHLLVRLKAQHTIPSKLRCIAQFGDIISARVLRRNLASVYADANVLSIKAPRVLPATNTPSLKRQTPQSIAKPATPNPQPSPQQDSNVVIAFIDFGFDYSHHDFITNGKTQFERIWVQSKASDGNKYGYGQIYSREAINKALQSPTPFKALGYHPGLSDLFGNGTHGSHVVGIACANGSVATRGYAANSPIIAVDMGMNYNNGADISLGDSVKLVEALDFIVQTAGARPLVINMSLGGHGDAHTGQTIVEQAIDNLLLNRPGTAIIQSTGNYHNAKAHHSNTLKMGAAQHFTWLFKKGDTSPNEMEIWYEANDRLSLIIRDETNTIIAQSENENDALITINNDDIGIVLHRLNEPNTGKNHINILTNGKLKSKFWTIQIIPKAIQDGRYHAYIERDDRGQSIFASQDCVQTTTTNSICNGKYSITVGAYNQDSKAQEVLPFSSSGPTADGRMKPEVVAAGHQILSVCSASRRETTAGRKTCQKSGSSMAAPKVAAMIVQLLERYPNLTIHQIRERVFKACTPCPNTSIVTEPLRTGHGMLNINKLIR